MNKEPIHPDFPKWLFWEFDLKSFDWQRDKLLVIQRVFTEGRLEDVFTLLDFYGFDLLKKEIVNIPDIDPKTLALCSTIFNIPKERFKCFNYKRSIPELSTSLKP